MRVPLHLMLVTLALLAGPHRAPAQCNVDWNNIRQRIDGFGASSAWRSTLGAQADMFFSTNNGIGLSLLRSRVTPEGSSVEIDVMLAAQERGARVWSTPSSPPAAFKDSRTLNGGRFISSYNQAYANQLARYVADMKNTYGINLYAISIQNEPDFNTTSYESCLWTSQQLHDFVPYLYDALAASNVAATKIMLPESAGWNFDLASRTMSDTTTSNQVGIVAAHAYYGSPFAVNYGKPLWLTEVSTFDTYDGSMSNGIYWAAMIHNYLTFAQVNAWHYWWLIPYSTDNQGLTDQYGNPAKRMYVLGQWSRFVRPNYYRIVVQNNTSARISAFKDPPSGKFVIVAININLTPLDQTFNLTSIPEVSFVIPWITSSNLSLASQAAVIVSNSTFSYVLPARSVVSFVGQTNVLAAPPVIAAQPTSQTVAAGSNGVFRVTAIGTTPLSYQWHFNDTNDVVGATHSSLIVFNAQSASAGLYSVTVSNLFGSVLSSNAALRVNHQPVADVSTTLPLVISANGSTATVILDGARSFDPDGDLMYYTWYEAGTFLAAGAVAVELMPVGDHSLSLVVNDGMLAGTNTITVEVITTAEAVERLIAAINSHLSRSKPLRAVLAAAIDAIGRRNPTAAVNQLLAFQNMVRVQVAPINPELAAAFSQATQDVIDALSDGNTNPPGKPYGHEQ